MKNVLLILSLLFLQQMGFSQTTLYVNPDANPANADGSLANPYTDIAATVELIKSQGGGDVIVVDGVYEMTGREIEISTSVSKAKAIIIKPQTAGGVKFIFNGRFGFEFSNTSKNITLQGFELDGETDELDYWTIVAKGFWGDESVARNGGLAVIIDGESITIKDNYIHDWYQKAIEIRDARYAVVQGNIIQNIATTSLSGGHVIMRQQKGQEFFDDDKINTYRWDISENLIFNVAQRIYSWVPSKGFIEMVIDEGKSILIDDPKDTDGMQEHMSARIKNNVVAYGVVDHIRLKSTPNLEVSNNSIFSNEPNGDGITDKQGDTETPQFTNFICRNNVAQTVAGISAIEIDKAVEQTTNAGGVADVAGNYAMDGKIKPPGQTGINQLNGGNLFLNPTQGNFRINPDLQLPSTAGVESAVLDSLEQKTILFNVDVAPNPVPVNHLKLSQTILDNIPGLNDGVAGNEVVFEDNGEMSSNYHTITYNVVNGDWKDKTGSKNQQHFELNEEYYTWYESVATTTLNSNGTEYERIRWGDSEVRQNQVFNSNWLIVSQIEAGFNTKINGSQNNFVIDGDILINFENFIPEDGMQFDLIAAKTITKAKENLFNRVLFKGYTPSEFTLEIADVHVGQVVRLTIGEQVSINENPAYRSLFVTPNPIENKLSIRAEKDQKISVFLLDGTEQSYQEISIGNRIEIDTSSWKSGVYLVSNGEETIKVIKK